MTHTKILKRSDGSRVNIELRLCVPFAPEKGEPVIYWDIVVSVCWLGESEFEFVDKMYHGQENELSAESLAFVTPSEILAAKLELWELLKPTI